MTDLKQPEWHALFLAELPIVESYEQSVRQIEDTAWWNAVNRGYKLLLTMHTAYVLFGSDGGIDHALIPSQTERGTHYTVNGSCECHAALYGKPCAHRAAKRLLQIAWGMYCATGEEKAQ